MSAPLVYLIAGEPSGDQLGAGLIRALRAARPGVEIAGIGGAQMRAAGLSPLFGIEALSVMGLTEVLPRLPTLIGLLRAATGDVLARAPQALVTIDAPAFGLRVAERVRRRAPGVATIHYVAPSVWAWRPGRARQMARYVDHVLCLLPFEPPLMEAAGMGASFVGHPVAEAAAPSDQDRREGRARLGLSAEETVLMVAPGSRRGEISRHLGPFAEAAGRLAAARPGLRLVVPVAETVASLLPGPLAEAGREPILVPPDWPAEARRQAMAAADLGLLKSGTIGLEAAGAGLVHISAYRASAVTAAILRRLLRVETGHLVNLVSGERAVPEFFQERCTGAAMAEALAGLLSDPAQAEAQRRVAAEVMARLGRGGPSPSVRAAEAVLGVIDGPRR